jgi:hypothetical protein
MGSGPIADGSGHLGLEINAYQTRMYLLLPPRGRNFSGQIFFKTDLTPVRFPEARARKSEKD